ncbi:MAG: UDP-N-acetylmuramoyl-L-alanine--D-glutamate ligase [Clostridiales bacterium]|nr:UDP-N-acetylmuramoyl-L-alanine--D-glutamate ligase [Clostridiales bacterium]
MRIFDGKKFLIYGNGISGKAAKKAIKRLGGKADILSDVHGAFTPPKSAYDTAVISPGIRPSHDVYGYCKEREIHITTEAKIGLDIARSRNVKTVGVTGTNGKTTVTKLIAQMTGGVACGNIGYPVSTAAQKYDCPLIVELSSFQLHNGGIAPHIAVIINMASDHVDWHGSRENYFADKCKIANDLTETDFLILGEDIPLGALESLNTKAQILSCSVSRPVDGAYVMGGDFYFCGERVCSVDYLRLPGTHNVKNALCAIAAAKLLNATDNAILRALSTATLSPHRIERVGRKLGKNWIDDSKGTNVSACLAAVGRMLGTVCLILGGRGKATDFDELFENLDSRVIEIVAMGETAQSVRDSAVKSGKPLKISVVSGLKDAVEIAALSSAQNVLLSPACASFDEFGSYAERGEAFKAAVKALGKNKKDEK